MKRRKNRRRRGGGGAGAQRSWPPRLPKMTGADVELGNFILGGDPATDSCREAARLLLQEIDGLPLVPRYHAATSVSGECRAAWPATWTVHGAAGGTADREVTYDPQDWGRKFLPGNGGSSYIDLDHLEICLPEVRSARDHVAAWHAMLRIARGALAAANDKLPAGRSIQAVAANSDGYGHSYGSHLNFLITRRAWDNLFNRKLHTLLVLAAYQVSSIVFTGQGKVGSENGAPQVDYQLSQRADFFETLTGEQTTYRRPVVNSRDEPLCGGTASFSPHHGDGAEPARLHVIFYDSTLAHVATFLKVGVMQILLAMLEAEALPIDPVLEDPLHALRVWSHDPSLRTTARTTTGSWLTALQVQRSFLERARRFADAGGCDGMVPEHETILDLWDDTLSKLEAGDLLALAARLDWALKLVILRRAAEQHRLDWGSPELKHLDLVYGNLDPGAGLYWAYEEAGLVERLVSDERIACFVGNPPDDTRAWTRAMLLRKARPHEVENVDWDRIRFRTRDREGFPATRTLRLDNPLGHTRATTEAILGKSGSLGAALDALGAARDDSERATVTGAAGATADSGTTTSTGRSMVGWPFEKGGRNGHEIS